jgi:hypothetical protein
MSPTTFGASLIKPPAAIALGRWSISAASERYRTLIYKVSVLDQPKG